MLVAWPAILPRYSGSQVAAELAHEQSEAGAARLGQAARRAVGERELAAGHARVHEDMVRAPGSAGDERLEAELGLRRARASCARRARADAKRARAAARSRRSTVAPWRPKNSSTESRTLGTAAKTPPARSSRAASAMAIERRMMSGRRVRLGAGEATRRPDSRGQVRRLRPVELAAQLREAPLEVAHASASPSSSRSRSSARESRDLTVPRGQSSAAAVSSSLRSRR